MTALNLQPSAEFFVQWRDAGDREWYRYSQHDTREGAEREVSRMADRTMWIDSEVRIVERASTYRVINERTL